MHHLPWNFMLLTLALLWSQGVCRPPAQPQLSCAPHPSRDIVQCGAERPPWVGTELCRVLGWVLVESFLFLQLCWRMPCPARRPQTTNTKPLALVICRAREDECVWDHTDVRAGLGVRPKAQSASSLRRCTHACARTKKYTFPMQDKT